MTESVEAVLQARTGRAQRTRTPAVVTSPKSSAAYQAHSYPTKIPPEAIVPFIEASTTPGAVVLDPFCGSGMTGVAALQAGRSVILSDLSPGAVHLASNHTSPADPDALMAALRQLDEQWMTHLERRLYSTTCPTCDGAAVTRHTIWSDVHRCGACRREVVLWDEADADTGSVPRWLDCECGETVIRGGAVPARSEPVHRVVSCRSGCAYLQEGEISDADQRLLRRLAKTPVKDWLPEDALDTSREMYKRSALHLKGITTVADFYLPRAKHALSALWARINEVEDEAVRSSLRFAFTNTAWHASRMRRYNARGGQRPLTGTLFIPQLTAEANAFEVFRHQVKQIAAFAGGLERVDGVRVAVKRSSAADLSWLADNSIDYVFTDPPFGSNIFYADCNFVWEAWLGEVTEVDAEMVVNRSRTADEGGKSVEEYGELLRQAFAEIRRALRPDGRASIVFHNSDDRVWTAMLRAAEEAGLKQTEVSILDKVQRSMKGYKGRDGSELVPFYDLVITFAPGKVRSPHLNGAGDIALEVVRRHLTDAERAAVAATAQERSLEYLYSLAVGGVVARGAKPEGLSYRAFEELCGRHFERTGRHFSLA